MKTLLNEISFYCMQLKQNFRNQRALHMSFFLQIIGMFINNLSFFVIWIMFSRSIGPINGWGPMQTFGMLSVSILVYGIVHTFFGSTGNMHVFVPTGQFDALLTKPKSLYIRMINAEFSVSAIGDLIQGILGVIIFLCFVQPSLQQIFIILMLIPPAVIIHIAFALTCDCVAFWLPNTDSLTKALYDLIMLPSTQPISLLQGVIRFFYLFVIPALLIAGTPIEAFTTSNWKLFCLSYTIAVTWFLISYFVLKYSLRRYESGNSIG